MKTSPAGIRAIKEFEGSRLEAYQDVVGVWSIGYGFTTGVQPGDTMTQAECDERLKNELRQYEQAVWDATGGDVTQSEFDALVSFAWNVGIAGMKKSSVIKAHNRGDKAAAARAFGLWNKAGGEIVNGLVRRRAAEAVMYLDDDAKPMPQAVDAPKPMTSSTTVIAAGTAALATVTQITDAIGKLRGSVDGMGGWMIPALAVLALAAMGYVIYERYQQRSRGAA